MLRKGSYIVLTPVLGVLAVSLTLGVFVANDAARFALYLVAIFGGLAYGIQRARRI